jgi:DNA-binding winged helix-turn-helix (wHTH) protein
MSSVATHTAHPAPAGNPARPGYREFRIDGWLVQPARNRLVKGATAVRVRPQLIDVLSCLAMQPGRVVTRDQLLSAVWSDRFIAVSGVARCMAELRQVLCDDARQPRIIETIPKRGYRLIAAVEPADAPEAPASAGSPAPGTSTGAAANAARLRLVSGSAQIGGDAAAAAPARPRASGLRGLVAAARSFLATGAAFHLLWR